MAVLSDAARAKVTRVLMRRVPTDWGGTVKPDLRAAVNSADAWLEGNASASTGTSFNSGLPQPFRGVASATDKAAVLSFVAAERAGLLPAGPED